MIRSLSYDATKRLKEAMEAIRKDYIEGCVAYYEGSGEWQNAFDEMEKSLLRDSENLIMNKIVWFEKTILTMCGRYKKMKKQADQMGLALGGGS